MHLRFRPFDQSGNIPSVHKDYQQSQEDAPHQNHRILTVQQYGSNHEYCGSQNRAQGHIAGKPERSNKDNCHDQGDPPVQNDCRCQAAENAFTAPAAQQDRKIVP